MWQTPPTESDFFTDKLEAAVAWAYRSYLKKTPPIKVAPNFWYQKKSPAVFLWQQKTEPKPNRSNSHDDFTPTTSWLPSRLDNLWDFSAENKAAPPTLSPRAAASAEIGDDGDGAGGNGAGGGFHPPGVPQRLFDHRLVEKSNHPRHP